MDATETIRRRYNRTALFYDWMDQMISPTLRGKVISMASGKVLEIGVGTGKNLKYYQNLQFADNTFDTVTATCVFCSVPDPVRGLLEAKRVCKPDGKIILLEHVRSDNPVLGWLMDATNPISLHLVGSNINRRTVDNILEAGLTIEQDINVSANILKLIIARP
ncbi:MAG: Methyltransferase type 11 [Anaerosporomusa subterranea]|nr:Methyltransferase type 11 [Anaerosporomusa subterranea]